MPTLTASEILRKEFGASKNFTTPYIIFRRKLSPQVACEFSWGRGIVPGSSVYGVTVVAVDATNATHRLWKVSACFLSAGDAQKHIQKMREDLHTNAAEWSNWK